MSILPTAVLLSQTCCSGGVPVSSNIGFSNSEKKILQLSLNTNFNTLKTLYSGSESLDDDQRKRSTQSYLVRVHYTFTDRFAIEGFFPFVRQTREIFSSFDDSSDFESSFGIGDPILLASYRLTDGPVKLTFGAGPQIPLGSFTKRNSRGLFLVEDLQPGSGAWDLILLALLEYQLPSKPSMSIFGRTILDYTGANPDSRNGQQTYEFGNDLQIIAGLSDQVFVANRIVYPAISLRYRNAQRDRVDDIPNSGTGGKWIFAKASIGFEFFWESSLTFDFELPVHTFVNETQLSPNSFVNISWHKVFTFSSSTDTLINF